MPYEARVLADSISPDGVRLTTFEATFPRFILAEVNTHRMLSRNSASSRAIPTEKIIERVITDPFVPLTFNRRVKGMGVGEALAEEAAKVSRDAWLHARDKAVQAAVILVEQDVDKSRVNRLLEPFMWHTAIISSTTWSNLLALRCPDGEVVQQVAIAIRAALRESEPVGLEPGYWHLPLVTDEERAALCDARGTAQEGGMVDMLKRVSASRCARVSFDKHTDEEPLQATLDRAERLATSGHWSPFEHQATPAASADVRSGNFIGWLQFRKEFGGEDDFSAFRAEAALA
jgi:hypothetical protein